ncbi:MAG: hypothetical protein AAF747_12180, partial [Planctomycetota bacterium]
LCPASLMWPRRSRSCEHDDDRLALWAFAFEVGDSLGNDLNKLMPAHRALNGMRSPAETALVSIMLRWLL